MAAVGRNKAIIKPKNKYFPVSAFIWNSLFFLFSTNVGVIRCLQAITI
jgi:hypothetical protein